MISSLILQVNPSYFPLFPAQTMSQQATRHARRVYVGAFPQWQTSRYILFSLRGPFIISTKISPHIAN
ncbi:hypothetical protein LIER_43389 [Lithospermum erythrorhizon]|uniref:Uncharacterized protein n=1 Tax=Lithospermum erythrorhizon TaxID=34254 RepID=A0AAV3Q1B2_LITER